jgi:hypothetical protein
MVEHRLSADQWATVAAARAAYGTDDAPYDEVLIEVQKRAQLARSLGKADIGALLFWKRLQANTPWALELNQTPDQDVRTRTARAFAAVNDATLSCGDAARLGRKELKELPGFRHGAALPSAVLLACAPDRMAVYDRRALKSLHAVGIELKANYYGDYMEIVESLVEQSREFVGSAWTARDIDKALFMMKGSV